VEEWIAAQGEHADRLRRLLPTVQVMAGLGSVAGSVPPPVGSDAVPVSGVLGDYRIIREVGRGGMGVVYEAEQISLGRRVALKVLPLAATLDPRQLQRFHNEARGMASLHHEHIVPVYAVGQERGVHYYAMQFIDGPTIAEVITQQRGPVTGVEGAAAETAPMAAQPTGTTRRGGAEYRRAAELVAVAAEALDYAHQMGVVHRDVKPANLMLDGRGTVWVTDFGLAQLRTGPGLTMTGDLVGTLRYMSPEQALAKHGLVDHRTDVYSLGATLYEVLTLQPVFAGEDRQELLRQIAFDEPIRLRKLNRAIPPELETIVLKAMEKNPQERYETAQQLADDLRNWLGDRPIQARPPGPVARVQKWSRRHKSVVRALGLGLVVAVVALAVSTVWAWHKEKQAEDALQYADGQRQSAEKNAAEAAEQHRRADQNFRRSVKVVTGLLDEAFMSRRAEEGARIGASPELERSRLSLANEGILVIQELLKGDTPTDPEGRLLIAQAYEGLGTAHLLRGEVIEAGRNYVRARDTCAQLAAEFPEEALYEGEKVRITDVYFKRLSPYQLGQVAADKGQHKVAASAFRDALIIEQVFGKEIRGDVTLSEQSFCHVKLADELRVLGQSQEAEQAYGDALVSCDLLAKYPPEQVYPVYVVALKARALASRGLLRATRGRLKDAEADFREALALVDGLKPDEQQVALGILHDRARVRSALGNVLWAEGGHQDASDLFSAAEKEWRQAKSNPVRDNELAWFLVTCPDTRFRNTKEAVELAQNAVKGIPESDPWRTLGVVDRCPWQVRRTLGVALFRAEQWKGASEALTKAAALRHSSHVSNEFFLAMIDWQLKDKEGARRRYDGAVNWMRTHLPNDDELIRFREEAAELLAS
jgi:serine/threonine protein kinase